MVPLLTRHKQAASAKTSNASSAQLWCGMLIELGARKELLLWSLRQPAQPGLVLNSNAREVSTLHHLRSDCHCRGDAA